MLKLPEGTDLEQVKKDIAQWEWFHQIEIAPGIVTPGNDPTPIKLAALHLPADLTGLSVLDVGAYNGAFSFECESRGAEVTANDDFIWRAQDSDAVKCFDYLKTKFRSDVKTLIQPVENLGSSHPIIKKAGLFDIVLFLGVLYHTPNPYLYLQNAASMVKPGGQLIVETLVADLDRTGPSIAYYPEGWIEGDPTTKMGPNTTAVKSMLKDLGLKDIKAFDPWDYDVLQKSGLWRGSYDLAPMSNGRQVFHAWKE